MAKWHGRSRGNVTGYRIFVFIIRSVGVLPAYFLLLFVSLYYLLFSRKTSKPILELYRQRLGFGYMRSFMMLYKNYFFLGQSLIDKVVVFTGGTKRFSFDFDGEHHIRDMVKNGKGGVLLSAHLGSWDIAGMLLLNRLECNINIVLFDGEDRKIKEYMQSVYAEKMPKIIYIRDDMSHVFEIGKALAANEVVCMHADRYLEGNKTIDLDFLGGQAKLPEGPFIIGIKMKKPVAFVYAIKENCFHYHFYATPAKVSFGDTDQSTNMLGADFAKSLKEMLLKYPYQWFNYYDFWAK